MEKDGGPAIVRRAEIDTSAPFRSVKEAVSLFGERVLVGEIYANKLKEMQKGENQNELQRPSKLTAELEETKQTLEKAREESLVMATCLSSLQQELDQTKTELRQLKLIRESEKQYINEIEDLKFVEDVQSTEFEIESEKVEFDKKRYVTFANPPSSARIMVPHEEDAVLERHPSLEKKKKKKPLIPLIGAIFSKKKSIS